MFRPLTKRQTIYVLAIILFILQFFDIQLPDKTIVTTEKQKTQVVYVVDGDTIIVDGNKKVRYIGINSTELKTKKNPDECFAREALDENKKLLENKQIFLEKDTSEVDKYKRLLRYVWADDIFVNDYLVRNGFAKIATYPPDTKYYLQFKQAEQEARENKRGLWGVCR